MRSRTTVGVVASALVVLASLGLSGCTPPTPTADFRFRDTMASSVGSPPDLINYVHPELGSNTFATETVGGSSRRVLRFAQGNGLTFGPSYPTVNFDAYTVAVRFRFETISGYRRVLDVKGGFAESGLYVRDGKLSFYPLATGTAAPVGVNKWVQVVLTRTPAGTVTGYVNGAKQFEFADAHNDAVIDNDLFSGIRLYFFVDNEYGGTAHNEHSAGAVARVRMWDRALTGSEVGALS